MATTGTRAVSRVLIQISRSYSAGGPKHYKLVVAGGGTGGCSVAARACRYMGQGNVAVIEPAQHHHYQPMWTLIGAGIKKAEQAERPMAQVLPKQCVHYRDRIGSFDPDTNTVTLANGETLTYDYLVIAVGIQINLNKVDGLTEALKNDPNVCTIYLRNYLEKTYPAIQNFKGGQAIFTFPNTPVKCAGAPQKIMYLADEYWRKNGVRDKTKITYNSSLGKIFGVEKYADSLMKVIARKDIQLNLRRNLKAINHEKKEATFELLDSDIGEEETYHYDFMHVCPPMSAPDVLLNSTTPITDESGFLDINKRNMQHNTFPNIFGLGDCTNVPTAKTAAAVAEQNKILHNSLQRVMRGLKPNGQYEGYTACPLITGYSTCILAEFDFDCQPLETFPFNQGKERRTMFYLKKEIMPKMYWKMMLKGHWSGPAFCRKLMHFGMSR